MSNDRVYMRAYINARYHRLRKAAVKTLGGVCVSCGATDKLEFDHIDPQTKTFSVGRNWSAKPEVIAAELHKCQLLCHKCHSAKTRLEHRDSAVHIHGTLSRYKAGCRCDACRAIKSVRMREAYVKKRKGC